MRNRIDANIAKPYLHRLSDIRIKPVVERKNVFWQEEQNCKERRWKRILSTAWTKEIVIEHGERTTRITGKTIGKNIQKKLQSIVWSSKFVTRNERRMIIPLLKQTLKKPQRWFWLIGPMSCRGRIYGWFSAMRWSLPSNSICWFETNRANRNLKMQWYNVVWQDLLNERFVAIWIGVQQLIAKMYLVNALI